MIQEEPKPVTATRPLSQSPSVTNSTQKQMEKAVLKTNNVMDGNSTKKVNSKKRPGKTEDANDTCGCIIF